MNMFNGSNLRGEAMMSTKEDWARRHVDNVRLNLGSGYVLALASHFKKVEEARERDEQALRDERYALRLKQGC